MLNFTCCIKLRKSALSIIQKYLRAVAGVIFWSYCLAWTLCFSGVSSWSLHPHYQFHMVNVYLLNQSFKNLYFFTEAVISSIFIIQAHALTLKSSCCHASQLGPTSALPFFSQQMHHLFAFSSPSKTVFLLFSHPNSLYNYINYQYILHLTASFILLITFYSLPSQLVTTSVFSYICIFFSQVFC